MSDRRETVPAAAVARPRMPRWVKMLIALGAVVAVVVAVMLLAGGDHSPQRHTGGGDAAQHTPPPGITHGEQP